MARTIFTKLHVLCGIRSEASHVPYHRQRPPIGSTPGRVQTVPGWPSPSSFSGVVRSHWPIPRFSLDRLKKPSSRPILISALGCLMHLARYSPKAVTLAHLVCFLVSSSGVMFEFVRP